MKKYKDGSFKVRTPLPVVPTNFRQDTNDPCLYVPDFPECKHRYRPTSKSPCGKVLTGGATCRILNLLVSVPDCKSCTLIET